MRINTHFDLALDRYMMLIYNHIYHIQRRGVFNIMGSLRTIITLSEKDKGWLESYSKANGISMAEAIRRGITRLKELEERNIYKRLVQETRGIWKKGDGMAFQAQIRSEWE